MKLLRFGIFLWYAILGFSESLNAHVALDYPLGGETFFAGEIVNIQWEIIIPHDTQNWDLYFSDDGGDTWNPLVLDIPVDQLNYIWHVPYDSTTEAKIKVVQDNSGMDYMDTSANFTIVIPPPDGPLFYVEAHDTLLEVTTDDVDAGIQQWLENHGGAMATGSCGDLVWTNNYSGLSDSCGVTGNALVTFTVSDDCGVNTTTAHVTVIDTMPPVVDMPPADITVQCDGTGNIAEFNAWLLDHGGAQISDAGGEASWNDAATEFTSSCGGTGTTTATFGMVDECGNASSVNATFTIIDTIPPVFDALPVDHSTQCDGAGNLSEFDAWLTNMGGAIATDVCGAISWSAVVNWVDDCDAGGVAHVTFFVSDECGNLNHLTAEFGIFDTIPPSIITPAKDTTIDCTGGDPTAMVTSWLATNGGAEAEDICGDVTWTHDLSGLPDPCMVFSQVVHFTVSDECGNQSTTEAVLSLTGSVGTTTQIADFFDVHISPNPVEDVITVSIDKDESMPTSLVIYDLLGHQLWTYFGAENVLTVSAHGIPSGVCFVQIRTVNNIVTRSFLVK